MVGSHHFRYIYPERLELSNISTMTYLRQSLLRVDTCMRAVPVEKRVAVTLWRLPTNIEYRLLLTFLGLSRSTVCVVVHQVCEAIVEKLSPRYIQIPTGNCLLTFLNKNGDFHSVLGH